MKTPITDNEIVRIMRNNQHASQLRIVCRRLEADRAALMEALETFIEEQCEQRPNEYSQALGSARAALSAARANFPEP